MHPSALHLLFSYLRNQFQRVKVGPARSEWRSLVKGVPQGSILGSSLFNLFLNDYLYFVRSSVINYADDDTICVTGETLDDCLNSCASYQEDKFLLLTSFIFHSKSVTTVCKEVWFLYKKTD